MMMVAEGWMVPTVDMAVAIPCQSKMMTSADGIAAEVKGHRSCSVEHSASRIEVLDR
jgi:hypothetical protein